MACNYTRIPVCVRSGDRNEMTLQLLKDGDPWDLTGAQAAAHVRASVTDADPALLADITPVDSANGIITLSWPGDEVDTLLAGAESWKGVWDLDVIEQGQTLSETPCGGPFDAYLDVTRVAAYEPLGPALVTRPTAPETLPGLIDGGEPVEVQGVEMQFDEGVEPEPLPEVTEETVSEERVSKPRKRRGKKESE